MKRMGSRSGESRSLAQRRREVQDMNHSRRAVMQRGIQDTEDVYVLLSAQSKVQ